jgi:hypothetical protein
MPRFHHDPRQRGRRLAARRACAAARDVGDLPAAANPAHGPEMPAALLARADEVIV